MKKHLFTLAFLCFTLSNYAQDLVYETSFEAAKAKAQASGKKVLVHLTSRMEIPIPTPPKGVVLQNTRLLEDPKSVEIIKSNFVLFKSTFEDDDSNYFRRKYNINIFPSYLFFHPNGDIFYTLQSSFQHIGNFEKLIMQAVDAGSKPTFTELKNNFSKNPTNFNSLKNLIAARKQVGITDNNDLLEMYSLHVRDTELRDYNTVLFILENGPYIDGNPYNLFYRRNLMKDSIFKQEPLTKRIAINNAMINHSMNKAIEEKNQEKALRTASFVMATWGSDQINGTKNFRYRMLSYYLAANDTTQYFQNVFSYVNAYINSKSGDEVREADKRQINATIERNKKLNPNIDYYTQEQADSMRRSMKTVPRADFNKSVESGGKVTTNSRTFAVIRSSLGSDLYAFAKQIYNTGTPNPQHLATALNWVNKALTFSKRAQYLETKAYLLYKLGSTEEAIKTMNEAIELENMEFRNSIFFQNSLKNMLSGKPVKLI